MEFLAKNVKNTLQNESFLTIVKHSGQILSKKSHFFRASEFSKKFRAKNVVAELFPKLEFLAKNVKNELK